MVAPCGRNHNLILFPCITCCPSGLSITLYLSFHGWDSICYHAPSAQMADSPPMKARIWSTLILGELQGLYVGLPCSLRIIYVWIHIWHPNKHNQNSLLHLYVSMHIFFHFLLHFKSLKFLNLCKREKYINIKLGNE